MLPNHLQKADRNALLEFKGRLLDKFQTEIVSIKLFGSKARGDYHSESDVDLLIIVKRNKTKIDEYTIDLVCDILNEYGVFIETVTYTEGDYKYDEKKQVPFTINVAKEGIVI